VRLTADQIRSLTTRPSSAGRHPVKRVAADSAEPGYEAENAVDGDPDSIWHTAWTSRKPGFPHELVIEFRQPASLRGVTLLPRQDNNRNGWIKDFAFYVSDDGLGWGEPAARGTLAGAGVLETVMFDKPRVARFLKLVAVSGYAGPYASLAELGVVD
jgi:hypothetical protein